MGEAWVTAPGTAAPCVPPPNIYTRMPAPATHRYAPESSQRQAQPATPLSASPAYPSKLTGMRLH